MGSGVGVGAAGVSYKQELVVDGKSVVHDSSSSNGSSSDAAAAVPVVEKKARYSNWGAGNLDPEQVSRHERSLRRAGFKDNGAAKGRF